MGRTSASHTTSAGLTLIITIAHIFLATEGAAQGIDYPILFTEPEQLAEFGIEVQDAGVVDGKGGIPPFPNKCYDLNTGSFGYRPISISDDLLDTYTAKGFTLETLCIALVSQARFDPETGERLPTYVLRDDVNIDQALDADAEFLVKDELIVPGIFPDAGAVLDGIAAFKRRDYESLNEKQTEALVKNYSSMTWEQPLAVPTCFKNGTPYLDCNWKFGLRKGKPFTAAQTKRIRDTGAAIDQQMKSVIASGEPFGFARVGFIEAIPGYLSRKGRLRAFVEELPPDAPADLLKLKELLDKDTDLTWYDASENLPRGYAVALFAEQNPDQAFSPGALNPKRHVKRLSSDRIKKALAKYN
jgi:hypothetical protein